MKSLLPALLAHKRHFNHPYFSTHHLSVFLFELMGTMVFSPEILLSSSRTVVLPPQP